MLGNKLVDFGKSIFKYYKYDKATDDETKLYKRITNSYKNRKKQFGNNFDVNKWAASWDELDNNAINFFANVKDGDDILEGLANSMGKTTKAAASSGDEIQLTGNKFKDFFIKTKSGINTFSKSIATELKGVFKTALTGIAGGFLNVGINLLIGGLIKAGIGAWQEYSNAQENAIDKSAEAVSKLQANQNKIKNAEEVLSSIKENKVIDPSGNEITRFEQLSQGVNSLGENISLTKSEFEEYNSILNSMSNAGLTATTSMANLEAQVKQIRKSSNIDSLKGLNDWVKGFNAQNNQLYSDSTKEIGYQQKLNALDKVIGKDGKKPQKVETQSSWDTLSANLAATNELRAAWDAYEGTNAKEHVNNAKKIYEDTELKKTETKALKEIAKEYSIDMLDNNGNIDYKKYTSKEVQNQLEDVRESLNTEVESMVRQSSGFLQALFENSPAFENVSKSAGNAISSIFNNIDYETVSKNMMDSNNELSQKMMKDWVTGLAFNLQGESIQEKLSQLFNLDSNSNNQTFAEYKQQAEGLIKDISSAVPQLSENLLKNSTGIKDILDSASTSYNRVVKTVGKDFADTLSIKDLELAADIISEQDVKNAEELSHALKEAKIGAEAKDSFEAFSSSISEATANLETLKSTMSESVSGSGISSENLKAFREMFGDDAEKALERTANGYHVNQEALAELQAQQKESLKTDYLSSLNKQYDQLRKVNEDLAKAAITGEDVSGLLTQKAGIEAQIESLKDLQYQYEAANSAYQKWINAQSGANERGMYENIQAGYEGIKDLIERGWVDDDVRTYVDLLSSADLSTANAEEVIEAYNHLGQTIGNSGYSILDFFTVDKNGKSTTDGIYNFFDTVKNVLGEEYASLEDGKYKFNFGEGRDQKVAEALGMDVEAVQSIMRAASEAGFEIHLDQPIASLEELKSSAETAKETLDGLNDTSLSDINLDSNSLEDIDSQIQKVQEHISSLDPSIQTDELDAANDILEYLVQKKEELSKTTDIQFNLSNEEVLDKLSNANDKLKELGKTDVTFDFQANIDGIDSQIEKALELLKQFKNEDSTVDISTEGAQEAVDILQALLTRKEQLNQPAVMKVDSSQIEGDIGSAIGKIQEFQQAISDLNIAQDLKNAGVDIDTSTAQQKVQQLAGEIQGLDGNVKASLGLNTDDFNTALESVKNQTIDINAGLNPTSIGTISSAIAAISPEIMVKAGVDSTLIDSYTPTDQNANVTYHVNADEVNKWSAPNKEATLTYNITTSGTLPGNKERTLTYKVKTEGSAGVNGTAHVNGTSGNANASGNWGIKKGGTSLVGELGTEILVRNSEFHTIGDNGAEFIKTKPGDIIFNHKQTEDLLENGYATGRGKLIGGNAHVDGTAYSHGSGGLGRPSRPSNSMGSNSSDKNNSNKKSNSKKKSSNFSSSATENAKEFEETLDWIEIKIDRLERKIKSLERIAGSAFETYATRSKALVEQMGEISNEISVQQQAYERYLQQANSVSLSDDYKTQVQNGLIDISTITDEDLKKNIDEYQQWYEKALDCKDAVEELTESVKELYQQAFDNITEEFDNYISLIEHNKNIIEGYIDQDENAGYLVSTKYYDSLIALENQTLNQLTEERNRLIASLNEAVSSGNVKEYSDAWFKMQQDINDVNEAIQDSTSSLIDYKNAIQEIQWDIFDKIQDRISDINKESDFLIELMSNDKLFDDKGNITEQGKATMGLHGVNYNTYMAQADDYKKEMEKIQKELAEDPHNQTLIDRKRELLELQRESIKSAEDEKQAIKDLVEDGINKQLDSLQKLIDKYNDALDSQKDLYDYQKEISKKQKEISDLEKQLAAYKGDNSEEGAAKRQELENQLTESKEDLAETQYEKSISEQKKLLDELYTEYETVLNMRLDNIDMLIGDVIANVNSESSGIKDVITSEADSVGYTITDAMNTIWGSNGISGVLTTYSNNFSSTMTGVMTAINDIKNLISKSVEASNGKSQSNISQAQSNQSQQSSPTPTPTPPPPPKPVSPQGDGTPNVGDKVTYMSGDYFYDSYGKRPLGHYYRGKEVYITHINKKGSKPYHISTGSKLGNGDLGWVTLEQLKGYKTGTKSVPKDGMYWTNEGAPETIVRKKDGALLTPLSLGDTVLKNASHNRIWEMANNPADFIGKYMPKFSPIIPSKNNAVNNSPTEIQINIGIEKVQDYNDFVRQLQKDNKFEKLIQSMTIDRIAGKSSLKKHSIKF